MRFRYPMFYAILFGAAMVGLVLLTGFYFLIEPKYFVALALAIGLLIIFSQFYEVTQSIWVDGQGIRLNSIFGERCNFSWGEISNIQSMGRFDPGIKITNQTGESIKISTMFEKYDIIIEWIREFSNAGWKKPQTASNFSNPMQATPAQSTDFEFKSKTRIWLWILMILILEIIPFYLFIYSEAVLHKILFAALLIISGSEFLHSFLREPVYIATKCEMLQIRFRSNTLRRPIEVEAQYVNEIRFGHVNGEFPQTFLEILLPENTRIKVSNFSNSNEEMYIKLSAWLKKYSTSSD